MKNMLYNSMKIFSNENLVQIRTMSDSTGELWFSLKDVGDILAIENPSDMIRKKIATGRLDVDDKVVIRYSQCKESDALDFWSEIGNNANDKADKTFINERAMFSCILSSNKQEAREFQRWVTHDVIPSINNGGYIYGQENLSKEKAEAISEGIDALLSRVSRDAMDGPIKALEESKKNDKLFALKLRTLSETVSKLQSNVKNIHGEEPPRKYVKLLGDDEFYGIDDINELEQ